MEGREKWVGVRVLWIIFKLGLIHAGQVTVPTFTTLHSFSDTDGSAPAATLITSGSTLYGASTSGGSGYGTVFALSTNGGGFVTLHKFNGNSDGSAPEGALLLSGNVLYGTTSQGGTNGNGTVFALNADGTGFRVLHTFGPLLGSSGAFGFPTNADGARPGNWPDSALIISSNVLYGTAQVGGNSGQGVCFTLNTNGTGFTVLHHFTGGPDGGAPSTVIISNNTLYGTGEGRASCYPGTIFSMDTFGAGFKTIYSFPGLTVTTEPWIVARLVLSTHTLFGTTLSGGSNNGGTIFSMNTDGTGFTNLHSFSNSASFTNVDGSAPAGTVALGAGTLYGATSLGGRAATGTVYQLQVDGTGFTTLYNFSPTNGQPNSGLLLIGNTLYGTTISGGSSNRGTVFGLSLIQASTPQITNQPLNRTNIVGTTATFTIAATGTPPLTYQWFQGSSPMSQQAGSTLTLSNITDAAAGAYSVVITNVAGSVTSAPAMLVVLDPPKINTQPLNHTNLAGSTVSFTVQATGSNPLSYQWQKAAAALANQRNSTLTLTNLSSVDAAIYTVVITNIAGSVTSAPASLVVFDRPKLNLVRSPANSLLSWPVTPVSFTLEFATNLTYPISWAPVSPSPVVLNGQNIWTNSFSVPQRFYRLHY